MNKTNFKLFTMFLAGIAFSAMTVLAATISISTNFEDGVTQYLKKLVILKNNNTTWMVLDWDTLSGENIYGTNITWTNIKGTNITWNKIYGQSGLFSQYCDESWQECKTINELTNPPEQDQLWTKNGNNIYYTSGNVWIWVTNPTEKLVVNGTGKFTNIETTNSAKIDDSSIEKHSTIIAYQWSNPVYASWLKFKSSYFIFEPTSSLWKIWVQINNNLWIWTEATTSYALNVSWNSLFSGNITAKTGTFGNTNQPQLKLYSSPNPTLEMLSNGYMAQHFFLIKSPKQVRFLINENPTMKIRHNAVAISGSLETDGSITATNNITATNGEFNNNIIANNSVSANSATFNNTIKLSASNEDWKIEALNSKNLLFKVSNISDEIKFNVWTNPLMSIDSDGVHITGLQTNTDIYANSNIFAKNGYFSWVKANEYIKVHSGESHALTLQINHNNNPTIGFTDDLHFKRASMYTHMMITEDWEVWIWTTNPQAKLHVNGGLMLGKKNGNNAICTFNNVWELIRHDNEPSDPNAPLTLHVCWKENQYSTYGWIAISNIMIYK